MDVNASVSVNSHSAKGGSGTNADVTRSQSNADILQTKKKQIEDSMLLRISTDSVPKSKNKLGESFLQRVNAHEAQKKENSKEEPFSRT